MKTTFKFAFAICMALFVSVVSANAQAVTTGTINFNVTVNDAFDLRSNGASTGTGTNGFTASTPGVANQALGVLLTVGDASPNSDDSTITASVPIRMRSNRTYRILATRATQDPASPINFDSSDISMALTPVAGRGAGSVLTGSDAIATGWGVGGGKTVGDLSNSSLQILNGDRISEDGDNQSGDNFATSSVEFGIKRQYYTPTSGTPFTQQLTLVIAAP